MSKEIRKPYIDTDVVESFLNEIAVLEKALRYIKSDDCVANIQEKIDILIQEIENICSSYEVISQEDSFSLIFPEMFLTNDGETEDE